MTAQNVLKRRWLEFSAVLGALALVIMRIPWPFEDQLSTLLLKSLLHRNSLAQDVWVHALMGSYYAFVPKTLVYASLWLYAHLGLSPEGTLACVQLLLWVAQAALMFRLAVAVTESEEAAFLAVILIGADLTFVMADAAHNLQGLRRSIGMPPLLWGLLGLVQGRRWQALAGIVTATYFHATPGMYFWPLLAVEEALHAWRHPRTRLGACLRGAALLAMTLPIVWSLGSGDMTQLDPEFIRMSIQVFFSYYIGGHNLAPADWVFMLEGAALVFFALWHGRKLKAAPILWRIVSLCIAFLIFGTLSYHAYLAHWPGQRLWALGAHLQPWVSSSLIEIAGTLAVSAWLMAEMRRGVEAVPVILLILALSPYHDFVLRLGGVGLGACMLLERRREAAVVTVSAAVLPFMYRLSPGFFRRLALACALKGGLFLLPAFHPAMGLGLIAVLSVGIGLSRLIRNNLIHCYGTLAAAGLIFLLAGGWAAPTAAIPQIGEERIARWIQGNTAPDAVILISPLSLLGTGCEEFIARAERSVYACPFYTSSAMLFGSASAPMIEHLKLLGMDFASIRSIQDYSAEIRRMDANLTPEQVSGLASSNNVAYLLLSSEHPWPGQPIRREGDLCLYAVPKK